MKSRRRTKRRNDLNEWSRNEKNGLTETEKETKASSKESKRNDNGRRAEDDNPHRYTVVEFCVSHTGTPNNAPQWIGYYARPLSVSF